MNEKSIEYERTLQFLYAALPMFQRVGAAAYKKNLANITSLCKALGDPQRRFKAVHVGGTNGKGSSSHMMAAILQCEGYKTGLYTSPHLKRFTERIKIDGSEIAKDFVVDFVTKIKPEIKRVKPSFFDLTVAMAFDYFATQEVDIAVIEVGLGGRLDSTNIIDPLVAMITNIGYDHQDLLGSTLSAIAQEKAGIIKPGTPAVIGEPQDEVKPIFLQRAQRIGSPLVFAQDCYTLREATTGIHALDTRGGLVYRLAPALRATCQQKNIVGVLAVMSQLSQRHFPVSSAAVEQGIAEVVALTGIKGRWQCLGEAPAVYCDVAHNEDGLRAVAQEIRRVHHKTLHVVFGVVRNKPLIPLLSTLPLEARYYFCQAAIPRALSAVSLQQQAQQTGIRGEVFPNVNEAIRKAKSRAHPDDLIVVTGSAFVVAEIEGL